MARRYSPNGIQIGEAAMVLQDCYPEWRLKWRSDRLEFSLSLGASEILVSKGGGRKPGPDPKQKQAIALTPKAIALYETQPRGRKGDWVSRLIELNAAAAIEPGTMVRPVGGVSTGTVVFGDDQEIVVRWTAGLRVHQMDELEVINKGEDPC